MEIRGVYRAIGPPEHLVHTERVVTLKSRPSLAETCSRPPKSCATHSRKSSCREGEQLTRERRGRRLVLHWRSSAPGASVCRKPYAVACPAEPVSMPWPLCHSPNLTLNSPRNLGTKRSHKLLWERDRQRPVSQAVRPGEEHQSRHHRSNRNRYLGHARRLSPTSSGDQLEVVTSPDTDDGRRSLGLWKRATDRGGLARSGS